MFAYTNGPTQNTPDSLRRLERWKVSVGDKTTVCTHTEKTRQINVVMLQETRNVDKRQEYHPQIQQFTLLTIINWFT